jgi:hypothetical protein
MVAVVLVGLWLVVIAPLAIVELLGRRRSTVAAFQDAIRGLDRSAASALALSGPGLAPFRAPAITTAPRLTRSMRARRQHVLLAILVLAALVSLAGVVLSYGRTSLAIHAFADQCLIAYWAGVVATNHRGRAPRANGVRSPAL